MSQADSDRPDVSGAGARVRTYASSDAIVTVPASTSIRAAATAIVEESIGLLVIGAIDRVEGVISERDIVRAVAAGLDLDAVRAVEIGATELVWVDADDEIGGAAEEMMEDYVRHVLVRDERGLAGILSIRDVLSAYTV